MSMDTLFVVKKNVGVIEIQTGRLRGRLVNQDVDDKCCERTNTKSEATLRGKCLLTLFILLSQHFKAQKKKKRCDKQTRKWRPRKEKYPTTSGLTSKVEGLPWLKKGELRRQTGKGSGGKSACVGERKICVCVFGDTMTHTQSAYFLHARPGPAPLLPQTQTTTNVMIEWSRWTRLRSHFRGLSDDISFPRQYRPIDKGAIWHVKLR